MQDYPYWQKQQPNQPLFPAILWNKPERRDQAGNLAIIGGNKLGFAGVAEAYSIASELGVGAIRVVLPSALKPIIPKTIPNTLYVASTQSGGVSSEATNDMLASLAWADTSLFIGDAGRNSQTAICYETVLQKSDALVVMTRDAIDLIKNDTKAIVEREQTVLVASFAQVQKLFQAVYYPKILVFSMQLLQLVEALHKFTISYPVTIVTLHQDHIIIADNGQVVTQAWDNPMRIWRGDTATRIASYLLWSPSQKLEAIATSLTDSQ